MDIWGWVQKISSEASSNGQTRLAELIDAIPGYTVNDEHEKLDAVYPELLELSRKHGNPWLEIFARHWRLQSKVLSRHDVKNMLGEAVDLLDFSSQDTTKDCPQSVCAVQDLASCYGLLDSVAYTQERIDVATETISKINPKWPCFDCIHQEYFSALYDAGRYRQALDEISDTRKLMTGSKTPFALHKINCHIKLGEWTLAEQEALNAVSWGGGESFQKKRKLKLMLIYALTDQQQKYEKFKLTFEDIKSVSSYYEDWCRILFENYKLGRLQDIVAATRQLNLIIDAYIKHGCLRHSISAMDILLTIAASEGDYFSFKETTKKYQSIVNQLTKDLGASEKLTEWECKLEEIYQIAITKTNQKELTLSLLFFKAQENPDDLDLQTHYFNSLKNNGYLKLAKDQSDLLIDLGLKTVDSLQSIGFFLLEQGLHFKYDEVVKLLIGETDSPDLLRSVFWLNSFRHKEDVEQALSWLDKALDISPLNFEVLERAALIARENKFHKKALKYYQHLAGQSRKFLWDVMVCAAATDESQVLNDACTKLGLDLENGNSESSKRDSILVLLPHESKYDNHVRATKVGPVNAIITEISSVRGPNYFGDEIVINPLAINRLKQKNENGDACDDHGNTHQIFKLETVKTKANYFYCSIDGVLPEEFIWKEFLDWCNNQGVFIQLQTDEDYQVFVKDNGVRGVYAFLACPENFELIKLDKKLKEIRGDNPMIWPALSEELKDTAELERQDSWAEEYDLW